MREDRHRVLDRCMWYALNGPHAKFSEKHGNACVYRENYARFAALANDEPGSFTDLAAITKSGQTLILMEEAPENLHDWVHQGYRPGYQMILEEPIQPPKIEYIQLARSDVSEMLELVEITQPGPFYVDTIELGDYYGVREDGRLIAMAGERMRLEGYTEISAVCTHPTCRGRGLGSALSSIVAEGIQDRGEIPFLLVAEDNHVAIRLYERLGFYVRMHGVLTALQRK